MFNSFEKIRKKADSVRDIDLSTLLQHHGCTKDPRDKAKWHTPHGVISVNGQKFMNWTLGAGGGGAIDLVIYLQGVGFKDAVFRLCNNFSSTPVQQNTSKQILKLPQRPTSYPKKADRQSYRIRKTLRRRHGKCRFSATWKKKENCGG
jgi:hypothetical protein